MYVPDIKKAVETMGRIWVQLYGQGETPMTGTYLRATDHRWDTPDAERRLASIGIPRTDIELRIVDRDDQPLEPDEIGEIAIRGATVMAGYWNNEAATAEALRNGWLHTGDLGYIDGGGYVFLIDRAKDMIISAGNNIYAREVEEAIITNPSVAEVAVIGVPDPYWGESVHAIVVLREGATLTADQVIAHVKERIASYKKPKTVEFVDELPKSANGKVLKRELRQARLNPGPAT
jgi:acyl-CoA synthetase (AMP-forming)/AMP-acid ligase II